MSLGFEEYAPGMDRTPRGWERIEADDEHKRRWLCMKCGIDPDKARSTRELQIASQGARHRNPTRRADARK